jgi:peptidyl-prolyl cis-trans isomerase SurA
MKRLAIVLCGMLLAAPVWADTANRIVARVNDDIITQGDIAVRLSGLLQEEDVGTLDDEQAQALRDAVVQRLLEERLILQEAKRLEVRVSSEEVLERLRGARERAGSKAAYDGMLTQLGLNEEQLKMKIREQLLVQKAIDREVRSKIAVTVGELSRAGMPPVEPGEEEVDAYHLLVRVSDERSPEDAQALAQDLYRQLQEGADFEALARQYSEGPQAQEGGRLGWLSPGELLPELDEVLFRLQPGEVSPPLQTRLGFHILKVIERRTPTGDRPGGTPPAERQLFQEKFSKALRKWIDGLRAKAYVELIPE